MEPSDALREYVSEKLEHVLQKYLRSAVDVSVVLSIERYWRITTITLQLRGQRVKSRERSEDMYSSIDLALGKLERQMRRYKDKLRDRKPAPMPIQDRLTFSHTVVSGASNEPEREDFTGEFEVPKDKLPNPEEYGFIPVTLEGSDNNSAPQHVKVLRSERFSADPMTVAEAIMQLNLQDRQFLVFTRAANSNVHIIYRRNDGNYGIIET